MRLSLRELLLIAAALSVGLPVLLYGGPTTSGAVVAGTALVVLGSLIQAAIARGEKQAIAIGFAIASFCYGALVLSLTDNTNRSKRWLELEPYRGALPTTHALRPLLESEQRRRTYYIDPTGKETRDPPPQDTPMMGGGGMGGMGNTWRIIPQPDTDSFMATGHAFWTLILGYLASKYAAWVYRKRENK